MTQIYDFDPSREPLPPARELWGEEPPPPDASDVPRPESPDEAALDAVIRRIASERPVGEVPRDTMWAAIAARRSPAAEPATVGPVTVGPVTVGPVTVGTATVGAAAAERSAAVSVRQLSPRAARRWWPAVAGLAATLAVGVGIGRLMPGPNVAPAALVAEGTAATGGTAGVPATVDDADAAAAVLSRLTDEHLGRTEALLVSAREGLGPSAENASLGTWTRDLLTTTRLLLDTEQLRDPRVRRLLQDLELTLALILQAQASGRPADLAAVRADLDDGDLLLRIRSAAPATLTDDIRGMSE